MPEKVIFFNIGWMERTRALPVTTVHSRGGKWVEENSWDHAMLNFQPFEGRYYGYGETGTNQANLSRLGAAPEQDRLEGVTVVRVSKSPAHGPRPQSHVTDAGRRYPPADRGRRQVP